MLFLTANFIWNFNVPLPYIPLIFPVDISIQRINSPNGFDPANWFCANKFLRRLKTVPGLGFWLGLGFDSIRFGSASGGSGAPPTAPQVRPFWWTWSTGALGPETSFKWHFPLSSSISLSTHSPELTSDIDFAFRFQFGPEWQTGFVVWQLVGYNSTASHNSRLFNALHRHALAFGY